MDPSEPGAAPIASLRSVRHRYGRTVALDGVSLEVPAGRTVAFIGPDGVGKSTLLGLVAGARRLQTGSVRVFGADFADRRARRPLLPRIAYMPQGLGRNLYAELSVFENLDFFGRLFGQGPDERRRRIAALLAATGLAGFETRAVGKLSGGMKQKLGLCCALIHDPDLLILDEPTTGVDPLSRRRFWEMIARLRAERPGMSVLVATAYMEEASRFDWLVAMHAGRVLVAGTPEALKARCGAGTLEEAFVALLPGAARGPRRRAPTLPRPPDGAAPVIVARGLTRRFGDFTAVDRVSFDIRRGEIFGFLGSNGCGKTTTMKMLTGLLPATEGEARLFGAAPKAGDLETRRRVGYMSQSFSLYGELTVRQNLELHARLFRLPAAAAAARVAELVAGFGLAGHEDALPAQVPLGVRQRLSLAAAIIHAPETLILDEPTSGVDPAARDEFWRLLTGLSRERGVTIFISTHFMNEGERCDRVALMHEGRVIACGAPRALARETGAGSLEDSFIARLDALGASAAPPAADGALAADREPARPPAGFSWGRLLAYSARETKELLRDPIRCAFSLLGTVLLLLVFGYGITTDVENLTYAVLDRDGTPASRAYAQEFSGSRYFTERPPLADDADAERRLRAGRISLAVEIPPGFGRDLARGLSPEVAATVDGAMPFRAETIRGYVEGLHARYLRTLAERRPDERPPGHAASVQARFRYNQDFKSVYAMVPAVISLLLIFIPAILASLGVVREKELGSIVNAHVTPVTRLEFLLGKQLPYLAVGMINFAATALMAVFWFGVPLKGSLAALTLGALLYVGATTGLGLLVSTFTATQIAALFASAVLTMLPAVQFSGMMQPVSTLEGAGALIGRVFPTTHFMTLCLGAFTKGLGFRDLAGSLLALAPAWPLLVGLSAALLQEQER